MQERRLRTAVLVCRNQNGWQGTHLISRPNKELPHLTAVPKVLRPPHSLTVKMWELIAPRLLDYLQASCCFDHLTNELASSEEVCLQAVGWLLLSSCRPTYYSLLWGSVGLRDNNFHYLSLRRSLGLTEGNFFICTMEIIAILKLASEGCLMSQIWEICFFSSSSWFILWLEGHELHTSK